MKKLSLRLRLTLMSSIMLTVACVILTLAINFSADKMVNMIRLTPSFPMTEVGESYPMTEINTAQQHKLFKSESVIAMILVVLTGSAITYFVSGQVLKPVRKLTDEVKSKNVNNLQEKIVLQDTNDEMYELSIAFNVMSDNLQKSFVLQKQFSADAAHELRTPLTVMQAKLEVFKMSNPDSGSEIMQMLDDMNGQLERLSKLVDDLLWFSKDLPLDNVAEVDLAVLIADVTKELSEKAKEKSIEFNISENGCIVNGNDALLERVFYNLLENAIKYSNKKTTVTVAFETENNQKIISVCDMGEGISDENKIMIFEPFFRIDKSRSRKIGGNGLGLAICKKILNKHNAVIKVKDNSPSGSVFKITFLS